MASLAIDITLTLIALIFFIKFFRYKKMAEKEFANFEERLEEEMAKSKEAQLKYESEVHYLKSTSGELSEDNFNQETIPTNGTKTPESLMIELEKLHKEKDRETKLRMEAEKQVELALQKTENIEQRLQDWKDIQEVNLKDAVNTITKISDNLHDRLAEEHESEVKDVKDEIHNVGHHICDYLDEIMEHVKSLSGIKTTSKVGEEATKILTDFNVENYENDLENILQSNDLEPHVTYFTNNMLDEKVKKLVPFDAFVALSKENCIIIDTKSVGFFQELAKNKTKNSDKAYEIFKKKIDRYLEYLAKPKYRGNIVNYFTSKKIISKNAEATIIMLMPILECEDEIRKLGKDYIKTLQENYIQLHDLESLDTLIKAS